MGKKSNVFARLVDSLLFQTATEMSEKDIEEVTEGFVRGAELAAKCGLDGIEIHAAHGCKHALIYVIEYLTLTTSDRSGSSIHFSKNKSSAIC